MIASPDNKFYEIQEDGLILYIKLTPKASKNQIIGPTSSHPNLLKVNVTAVPENGKANTALIKLLSKHFKIAQSNISILQGNTSRLKTVKILGDGEQLKSTYPLSGLF